MPNTNLNSQTGCEYELLDGDIHYFLCRNNDRVAVNEFIVHYRRVLETSEQCTNIKLLIDMREAGIPPLLYAYGQVASLYREFYRPKSRAVYLTPDSMMVSLTDTFLKMLKSDAKRKFITGDATPDDTSFDEAVAWILEK